MSQLLMIIIIYIVFMSVGLPESLFGVAWPEIQNEMQLSLNTASVFFADYRHKLHVCELFLLFFA